MRTARTAPVLIAGSIAHRAMTLTPSPALTSSRIASVSGTCDTRAGSTPAGSSTRVKM